MIEANINNYLRKIMGQTFKFDNFRQYIQLLQSDNFTESNKLLFLNQLDGVNETLRSILNNDLSFDNELYKRQKVVLSYGKLLNENADASV
jgi:hypothetical protein